MAEKLLDILEDVQKGISPSYLGKFQKIVNFDVKSVPGAIINQNKLQVQFPASEGNTYEARTFTVDTTTDEIIFSSNIQSYIKYGQSIRFTTTGTLPAGLSLATTYYAAYGSTNTRIKVATTFKNLDTSTFVDITGAGTGTHTGTPEIMGAAIKIIPLLPGSLYKYVALDDSNKIWVSYDGTSTWMRLPGHGTDPIYGLTVYKNFIFVFHQQEVDCFGKMSADWSTGVWYNAQFILNVNSLYHPTVIMSNDILYVGDENYISTFEEKPTKTFDVNDATTYTFNANALDLPSGEVIYSVRQLGANLAIGTGGKGTGKIYAWDTFSSSFYEPIRTELPKVSATITVNNVLYFISNTFGTIYATNGITTQQVAEIPKTALDSQQSSYNTSLINDYDCSIIVFQGKLLFGISGTKMPGIYSYDLRTKAMTLEYTVSSGSTTNETFYALCRTDETSFLVGVNDASISSANYRKNIQCLVDPINTNFSRASNPYFETGMMQVGTKRITKNYQFFEVVLGKKLASNEVITLAYRLNETDSYSTIGTMDYSLDGAIYSKVIDNSTVEADQIQFKVSVTSNGATGPEIKAIYAY